MYLHAILSNSMFGYAYNRSSFLNINPSLTCADSPEALQLPLKQPFFFHALDNKFICLTIVHDLSIQIKSLILKRRLYYGYLSGSHSEYFAMFIFLWTF